MNAFSRRGACPALSAPMQTGDGLLVRLNPIARGISVKELIGLCESALGHGNGIIEVTARGSLQIRGLTDASAAILALEIDALGIAVRIGVPVETGALAGLDPEEIADPTPLADSIRASITDAGLEGRLGPKVSVVVDGGGRSGLERVAADVRVTAERHDENTLWLLSLAGDSRTADPVGVFTEAAACDATLSILEAIAAMGIVARARDLATATLKLPISPLVGEMSGRTEGRRKERCGCGEVRPGEILALADSRHALGIALPFGHARAESLIEFASQADALGARDIRFAPRRTLLALCPTRDEAVALRERAEMLDFVVAAGDPRSHVAACPGAPACTSGRIAAREVAAELAGQHGEMFDGSVTLHVSGCAKGCAQASAASLTIVGSENGAGIVVGGTAKDQPAAYTTPDGMMRAFSGMAVLVDGARAPGETTAGCLARLGAARIAEAFRQG